MENSLKSELLIKSQKTVQKNLNQFIEGSFFSAGYNQFRSLWLRDFCYSVPGLLAAGFEKEVTDQLLWIAKSMRPSDYLLPRGFDVVSPKLRVVWITLFKKFPNFLFKNKTLKAEFYGEHVTVAFDSNFLFLKALCELADFQKTKKMLIDEKQIFQILSFYDSCWNQNLLVQPVFSDWQDSVSRNGSLLLSQLSYLDVCRHLELITGKRFATKNLQSFENEIQNTFYDSSKNLFFEEVSRCQYSLDSHLLILNSDLLFKELDKKKIYLALKKDKLWMQELIPGVPVYPAYSDEQVSWTTKAVGLRHYHDGFIWGWLTADSYRCAIKMQDTEEANRILDLFLKANESRLFLSEIYEAQGTQIVPVQRFFYKSECPFTWTAAKWIQALSLQN